MLPLDLEKHESQKVVEFLERTKIEGLPIYIDRDFSRCAASPQRAAATIRIDFEGREVARAAGEQKWDHA